MFIHRKKQKFKPSCTFKLNPFEFNLPLKMAFFHNLTLYEGHSVYHALSSNVISSHKKSLILKYPFVVMP